jgi:2-polyprenyl-3-methyl-5-hydroxy-6-metoxy-1,4-benzoquinol methylase
MQVSTPIYRPVSNKNLEGILCCLCGNSQIDPYRFGLLQCAVCGLIMDRAAFAPSVCEKIQKDWFDETRPQVNLNWTTHFEARKNRVICRRLLKTVGSFVGKRVLEVGVGSGSLLSMLRRFGASAEGCDISPLTCDRVERAHQIKMHACSIEQLPLAEPGFDLIVCNHVLEHTVDPVSMLRNIYSRLAMNGVLHLAVPNASCWEAALPGWNSYEPYHMIYYNRATLLRVLAVAHFQPNLIETRESFSGWFLSGLRTVLRTRTKHRTPNRERSTSAPQSSHVRNAYYIAMVLAGVLTSPLRLLQSALGAGDEIVVMASRETLGENG